MSKTVIQTINVFKIYNEDTSIPVRAVNGINMTIEEGEFTAVVGPSGSGKSTLLNMIGGLDQPTSGSIIVNGTNLAELSSNDLIEYRKNHIGFVFQAYNLVPVLTSKENVELVMMLQGVPEKERSERSRYLLEEVGLSGEINRRPAQLSGGQQQRVAVARALASKPSFVLADEPTANLDSESTFTLLDIMKRLNEQEKTTFIFSTHDQRVIERANRVISIDDGRIISDDFIA